MDCWLQVVEKTVSSSDTIGLQLWKTKMRQINLVRAYMGISWKNPLKAQAFFFQMETNLTKRNRLFFNYLQVKESLCKFSFLDSVQYCWFHGSSFKGFSVVFPAPWLAKVESSQQSNGMWFFRHFSRHICSTVAETIGVTSYATSFGAKNVQKTTFEAAEMILGPWNQQNSNVRNFCPLPPKHYLKLILIVY